MNTEITPNELQYAKQFIKASDATFSSAGKQLKLRVLHVVQFTAYVSNVKVAITSKEGFASGVDSFLANFNKLYNKNREFKDSLLVCLMKACVAKVDGVKNPQYGTKVLNFYLALSASGG